ncbi:MAG: glycosyltransferase family 39 protein [Deltaproteobacteria bacterium]|nr:glycosyltransferase family 39 protein [Deltaproteobacteria bacterium]
MTAQATDEEAHGLGSRFEVGEWLVLGLVSGFAIAFRIHHLPEWFSYDESQHYLITRSPLLLDFVREFRIRTHPPLSYLLIKPFVALGPSLYWAKTMSMLAGLGSIWVAYIALRRATRSIGAATCGALLVGFVQTFVEQSFSVRGYSLMLLFIWLSLLQHFRMVDGRFDDPREQVRMAVLLSLALASEYSAVFHVLALSAVVVIPIALDGRRPRRVRDAFASSRPYVVPLVCIALFFGWQFQTTYPVEHVHTRSAMYPGSWADLGQMGSFLYERVVRHANGLIRNPWGAGILALALLPVVPGLPRGLWTPRCRRLSAYCAAALALLALASLLHLYPLGGVPRHASFIVPGVLAGGLLAVVEVLRATIESRRLRAVVGGSLMAALSFGVAKDLSGYTTHLTSALVDSSENGFLSRYLDEPTSMVTNWKGRTSATTWFFRGAPSRLVEDSEEMLRFDIGGITLVQFDFARKERKAGLQASAVARWATRLARREGRSWIVLSDNSQEQLVRERDDILRRIAAKDDIEVRLVELGRYAVVGSEFRSRATRTPAFGLISLVMMIESR